MMLLIRQRGLRRNMEASTTEEMQYEMGNPASR